MGVPSAFVRASGCNLRCGWCDTPYASWNPEGEDIAADQIAKRIDEFKCRHVVLTGGEPMIMPDIVELSDLLKSRHYHITLETAATIYKPMKLDLASLSPKLRNSTPLQNQFADMHEKQRLNIPVIQQFIDNSDDFQLKFVISSEADLGEVHTILGRLRNWHPSDVLLMPEGIDAATLHSRAGWIADVCKTTGFRFCPRLHIALFGNRRGT